MGEEKVKFGFSDIEENEFYDRILNSWIHYKGKDSTLWLAKSILSLCKEDQRKNVTNRDNWNKILSNCFIIMLALTSDKDLNQYEVQDFSHLTQKMKEQVRNDLSLLL